MDILTQFLTFLLLSSTQSFFTYNLLRCAFIAEGGARVLSVGCGSGHKELMYAKMFTKSTFIGIDIYPGAIDLAAKNKNDTGVDNAQHYVHDIYDLPIELVDTFDGVMGVDVLHDLPQPCDAVKKMRKLVKAGGFLCILDMPAHKRIADNTGHDMATPLYIISLYHC